jgi:hypothetical protein
MAYKKQRRQIDNNVTFYVYFDTIKHTITHIPHINTQMVETSNKKETLCTSGFHPTEKLTADDVCLIANDWEDD